MTLKKRWFDEILAGTKRVEYREVKPYWTKRLFDNGKAREFDVIEFKNGYSRDARKMRVEFLGVDVVVLDKTLGDGWNEGMSVYGIRLGEVL